MAEISNFPSRKKNKGFLSTMTAGARAEAEPDISDDPAPRVTELDAAARQAARPTPAQTESTPSSKNRGAKQSATHNTTVNLTVDQRAWLRWREVVTKQSMGDLIREAVEDQMQRTPMPSEVAAIFRS